MREDDGDGENDEKGENGEKGEDDGEGEDDKTSVISTPRHLLEKGDLIPRMTHPNRTPCLTALCWDAFSSVGNWSSHSL
ncbi:hypothetical protein [Vibrio mediterranei]|uniref:hypothetical protein n=1 Tax=Vibrio mediterranei TaxID=689 RepID=UPI00406822F9